MTNTYNTLNPLGSTSAKDLSDNSSNFDEGMNSLSPSFYDRFKRRRETWAGMEKMVSDFLEAMGFEATHLQYLDGTPLTVLRPTQLIDRAGSVYKVKQPASFPVNLIGTWATDQLLLIDVGDASLRNTLLSPSGDTNIGTTNSFGVVSTVGARLDLIDNGVIYSDDPLYGGSVQAAADAMGVSSTLVLRGTINLSTHLVFWNKVNPVVVFAPGCRVIGVRPFTFAPGLRGILDFYECSNPVVYRPRITGTNEVKVFPATIPSLQLDGDSGIEFIRCSGARVLGEGVGKLDYFMGWGVIYVECTDVVTDAVNINWCTQESGIGHAGVQKGVASNNVIDNVGLYGIEVEGTNSDIRVFGNKVNDCYQGISLISNLTTGNAYNNEVSKCTYGFSVNAIGGATDSGNSITNNQTYDCLFHHSITDTNFLGIRGNHALSRAGASTGYTHQRALDFAYKIIDATSVLIPDSSTSAVNIGDIHQYVSAGYKTVQSFGVLFDSVMGSCTRVTYDEGTVGMISNDMFRRLTDFGGSNSRWLYVGGSGVNELEVHDNVVNVISNSGIEFAGVINGFHGSNNKIRTAKYAYVGTDSTPITNSSIHVKTGDLSPSLGLFSGFAQGKLFTVITGEVHTVSMIKSSPSGFTLPTGATVIRVRLNIFNSSAASAPVLLNMNGTTIITIPAASFGSGPVYREVFLNSALGTYTFEVTGGGAMTLSSATVEANVVS